ncbi:GNAT family N-acetyltransferase [Bartonella tamiae]|uniref:BioF2-like acetyltransferase domain-containing protein n=1 Tax=Bartonella tamiae Th239 TaxID=1094558 RepID=J0R0A9_9HYPH|nr:GNAT family N-acetyltransferase [Bartonella tamiae]EJF88914.1 hypothetical protein ME5_01465 [Bartonella tamiae Th239]EJF94836.1 hypothetical protein MEG_00417 [Bartonella tamiae Th307]
MTALEQNGLELRVGGGASHIHKTDWKFCGTERFHSNFNPFLSHAFLSALERSHSVGQGTGWDPQFLRLYNESGQLNALVPCYIKTHSQGEYVFDHIWADAFEQAGGHYYPKLQISVPFTPVTGPKLLSVKKHRKQNQIALTDYLKQLVDFNGLSSAHITFLEKNECELLKTQGFLIRKDRQYHFCNEGYSNFDEFLQNLSSRKRKVIKRERRAVLEQGIDIEWLSGRDLTEEIWDDFFVFYQDTGSRKWGYPYLTRMFYSLIGQEMGDDIVLMIAKRNGKRIAGAINFIGADRLYGRHWGAIEDHPFLHFELCYYQAIDYAIAHKISVVEAGAQGEHKIQRGYLPIETYSAHYFTNDSMQNAVKGFLKEETKALYEIHHELLKLSPFKSLDKISKS